MKVGDVKNCCNDAELIGCKPLIENGIDDGVTIPLMLLLELMLSISNLLVFCLIFVADCANASTDAGGDVPFTMKLQFPIRFSL